MNLLATILACWIFCPDCPPPPEPFWVTPLPKYEMSCNQVVRIFYLDNGQSRPLYYFRFENLYPGQTVEMPKIPYFSYAQNPVCIACDGTATIIAFTNEKHAVPERFQFMVNISGGIAEINTMSIGTE